MIHDKVLYTDGHDVTITDTMLMVRNMSYQLVGITKHGLHIVKPHRLPGYLLFVLGLMLVMCGILNWWPATVVPAIHFLQRTISGSALVLGLVHFLQWLVSSLLGCSANVTQ